MENNLKRTYSRFTDYSLKVLSVNEQPTNRKISGRVVILPEESEATIIENAPRGPRSIEIGRSINSRLVKRHDGKFTMTLRFDPSEKYILSTLIAQVRELVSKAILYNQDPKRSDI